MLVDFRVTQLLCSRICHDLIGPAGALNTGMELIGEMSLDKDGFGQPLEIVADSARQLSDRLSFFRAAFGFAGVAQIGEARSLALAMLGNGRVELDWPAPAGERKVGSDTVKLVLNMTLLGIDFLPRGGSLRVRFAELTEGLGIAMTAVGKGARIKDDLRTCLADDTPIDEITSYNVHGYLAARLAECLGAEIEICKSSADQVNLAALVPDRGERRNPL